VIGGETKNSNFGDDDGFPGLLKPDRIVFSLQYRI